MPSTMLKKPVLLIILDGFGHREDEDHKCIDITLCILRDFEHAKSKDFINEVE